MLLTRALYWITANPTRFAELTAQRMLLFWFPPFGKGSDNYPLWAITLLGFAGLALCAKHHPITAALLGSALLLYPLIYYCIQHFTRYRYPILWISSLLASYALDQAWLKLCNKYQGTKKEERTKKGRKEAIRMNQRESAARNPTSLTLKCLYLKMKPTATGATKNEPNPQIRKPSLGSYSRSLPFTCGP